MSAKTLLITYDFPPLHTGIGSCFYNIWQLMPADDSLILAPKLYGYANFDRNLKVKVIRYPVFSQSKIVRTVILLFCVAILITKKKIGLLFCGVPLSLGIAGLFFKKIIGLPYAVFYYGGEYAKYYHKKTLMFLLRLILRNARWVITNSEYTSSEVSKFGIKAGNIVKITPAIDLVKFRPGIDCSALKEKLGLRGKKILLTVARLVRRKGVDAVINALALVEHDFPDIIYVVIGNGQEGPYLKNLAREKGLEKNILFLGSVTDKDLPVYYNACDIYIMLNRVTQGDEILEGFGISFIEASACARPVIAGVSGGVADAVVDKQTGLLVEPDNIQQVSQAIIGLLKNEDYAARLGENGRKRIESEFRLESRAQRISQLIKEVKTN